MQNRPPVSEQARAKVNLALHVTGRRDDGYHLLDSLVAFADVGDTVTLAHAAETGLTVTGRFAAALGDPRDNIVFRALSLFDDAVPVAVTLTKTLPVSAGIGGGSADAAACLRAYARLTGAELPRPEAVLSLGADVPVCLAQRPARMRGIGDVLQRQPLPDLSAVLVNPGVTVATATIFRRLSVTSHPAMDPDLPQGGDAGDLIGWLSQQRNDLQASAITVQPVIATVLQQLDAGGAVLARMSGSGATCFGLFRDRAEAKSAARRLAERNPLWWVRAARLRTPAT